MGLSIGLLLLIPLSVGVLVYYQCAQNRRNEANIEQQQAGETATSPTVHQPNAQAEHANTYDAGKDCLYRLYLFATIAGVCVALGGIYVIYKQTEATAQSAKETARSAKATEDSVRLQGISLRQWVNIERWEVWMDRHEDSTSTLRIRFPVVNPTALPIDLRLIDLNTWILGIDAKPCHERFTESEVLAPNNPFVSDITVHLSGEETNKLIDWMIALQSMYSFVALSVLPTAALDAGSKYLKGR